MPKISKKIYGHNFIKNLWCLGVQPNLSLNLTITTTTTTPSTTTANAVSTQTTAGLSKNWLKWQNFKALVLHFLKRTSSLFFQPPWTPPGPVGALGAVAARHAEEG